jgi:hypothetical protein
MIIESHATSRKSGCGLGRELNTSVGIPLEQIRFRAWSPLPDRAPYGWDTLPTVI